MKTDSDLHRRDAAVTRVAANEYGRLVPDVDSAVAWPLKMITARLIAAPAAPGLLLSYAEALEEAAAHAEVLSSPTHPISRGLRDLASAVRSAVPARNDTHSEMEPVHDPL